MNKINVLDFATLDLGSAKPISVPMETIEVVVTAEDMVQDYADAFVKEAIRKNPLRAEQVNLTTQEMRDYAKFLLVKRIECVHGECGDWRRLKSLWIPVFLQYSLRMIGEVKITDRGLRIMPIVENDEIISLEEALQISNKIAYFESDLNMVQDAMPRDNSGDESVMSTALIAGYVRSMEEVSHASDTYVSAFLGMKIKEEQAFSVLYRVQYDDVQFIRAVLTSDHRLF
jgi:hypothetical protein